MGDVLKHTDDDGDLSVFASGDELLFACSEGHAWTVDAAQVVLKGWGTGGAASNRGRTVRALEDFEIAQLSERFGMDVYRALGR